MACSATASVGRPANNTPVTCPSTCLDRYFARLQRPRRGVIQSRGFDRDARTQVHESDGYAAALEVARFQKTDAMKIVELERVD